MVAISDPTPLNYYDGIKSLAITETWHRVPSRSKYAVRMREFMGKDEFVCAGACARQFVCEMRARSKPTWAWVCVRV